jgi:biopolymer transport protein ExbD
MTKRLKRCCAIFALTLATIAAIFVFPAAQAAVLSQADPDDQTLVVRLDADGSLSVSIGGREAASVALPSAKAFPAEIDALIPKKANRKTLTIAAESTGPWGNLNKVMWLARRAGFAHVAILGPGTESIGLQGGPKTPPHDGLFVYVGEDGQVIVSLGVGAKAHGTTVSLSDAPNAAADLVPKERSKQKTYLAADLTAPMADVLGLMRKLKAMGLSNLAFIGETPDAE